MTSNPLSARATRVCGDSFAPNGRVRPVAPSVPTIRSGSYFNSRIRIIIRRHDPRLLIVTDNTGETKGTATETITASHRGGNDDKEAPDARFCDLGPGYYESRINKHRRARDLATQLQALTGQHIAIRDGKAVITDTAA